MALQTEFILQSPGSSPEPLHSSPLSAPADLDNAAEGTWPLRLQIRHFLKPMGYLLCATAPHERTGLDGLTVEAQWLVQGAYDI